MPLEVALGTTTVDYSILNVSQEVREICAPLLQNTPITHFEYFFSFSDNTGLMLSTNPDWLQHYFTEDFRVCRHELDYVPSYGFITHALPFPQGLAEFRRHTQRVLQARHFQIYHCCFVLDKYDDYTDACVFGIAKDDIGILQYYLNHLDSLQRFKAYFVKKAAPLIERLQQKNKLLVVSPCIETREENLVALAKPDLLQQPYRLSRREYDCLNYVVQGKTVKEIADIFRISPSTVNAHISHVKDKLQCHNKSQLKEKIFLMRDY